MTVTHAGAVAFRETPSGREYLVISSTNGGEWVLPKGHIQKAESVSAAALRELMEESGVEGRVIGPLKLVAFKTKAEDVSASFMLVRSEGERAAQEKRSVEWLQYSDARERLSFDEARSVLDEAERILRDRCLRKIGFMMSELDKQIVGFDKESSKHKRMYRRLRYPAIVMTAFAGALATLAITFPASQLEFNLAIVGISVALTMIVAIEALRMPRDLWIHERRIYYALKDLQRELTYRSLETSCGEQVLDAMFAQLQAILGSSGETWQEFLRKQEKAQTTDKPEA